jgi:hypothetical protein
MAICLSGRHRAHYLFIASIFSAIDTTALLVGFLGPRQFL